jgi:hypothetical protein
MRRFILTIILTGTVVMLSYAQDYKTGLGLRLGTGTGFTIKHFLNEKSALEGLLLTRWHGFDITGLYEKHAEAFDTDRLQWFYGFGAHLGFYNGDYVEWGEPGSTYNVLGIDGIIGIEYSFTEAPINLGLDVKPALNLIGYSGFWADFGLSVRYIF